MGFMDNLLGLFGPQTPQFQQINIARANQANQLQDEYNRANADPEAGMSMTPAMRTMAENALVNDVRGRMSDAGAGMSGASNDAVQKAIVEFRMGQMASRQKYLDSLRQGMLTASTPQSVTPSVGSQMASRFANTGAQAGANALFGIGNQQPNPNNYGYPGYPQNPQSPQGGMGVKGVNTVDPNDPYGTGGQD